ncbi:MAG: radical SAM family heme chaperone HemW [Planctomycetaceae bacterium]|nr:radical SAM family heme chaperone HemW [Planctomycetaceae bacterium]
MFDTKKVDFPPSLYIHIPFCLSRCGYCAFVSGRYDAAVADAYLDALEKEMRIRGIFESSKPSTVFIGGGTPSSLSPDQLQRLVSMVPLPADNGEFTCEMNPDSASEDKLRIARDGGVNRISFGVQTFSPAGLKLLGRRHGVEEAVRAVETARRLGFTRISIDLINGYPGQSDADVVDDCRQALDLGVDHISCYNFILEEDAPDYTRLAAACGEPDDERDRRMWDSVESWLCGRGGLNHYEISNFARKGEECQHNLVIWRGGEYTGIGLSACGYRDGRRYGNTTDLETYLGARDCSGFEAWSERLVGESAARERAVFWFRLYEGVELSRFRDETGYDFLTLYSGRIEAYLRDGVMEYRENGSRLRVAPEWMPVLDAILVDLV